MPGILVEDRMAYIVHSHLYFYIPLAPKFVKFMNFLTIPHIVSLLCTISYLDTASLLSWIVTKEQSKSNQIWCLKKKVKHAERFLLKVWGDGSGAHHKRNFKLHFAHSLQMSVLPTQVSLPTWHSSLFQSKMKEDLIILLLQAERGNSLQPLTPSSAPGFLLYTRSSLMCPISQFSFPHQSLWEEKKERSLFPE